MLLFVLLDFDVTILYVSSSNFPFSVFGGEKDRFSFIFPKVNAQLVIYKPVAYTGEVLPLFAPDLYAEITNMYHLLREIDYNLQPMAYC